MLRVVPEAENSDEPADEPVGEKRAQDRAAPLIPVPVLGQAAHLCQPLHHGKQGQQPIDEIVDGAKCMARPCVARQRSKIDERESCNNVLGL